MIFGLHEDKSKVVRADYRLTALPEEDQGVIWQGRD